LVGEEATARLQHFASTTREPSSHNGRITTLIESGDFFRTLNIPGLDPQNDRIMLCGSMGMIRDVKAMLEPKGFTEGSNAEPGNFVVERAFVG
jgi:ferredoxin--NADP+ reductase